MFNYVSSRIGRKILWMFISISIVSIIVISGLSIFQLRVLFTRKSAVEFEKIGEELYYNINRLIVKGKTDIQVVTRNPVITSDLSTPDEKLSELQKLQETFKIYEDITIIDPEGLVITSTHYSYRGDWRYKKHFIECLKGKTVVSNVQAIHSPEKYIIDFTAPVYDDTGRITAIVAAQLDMKTMSDIITHVEIDSTGHAFLLNEHNKIIAHRDKDSIFLKPRPELIEQITSRNTILQYLNPDGERMIGAYFDRSKLRLSPQGALDSIAWVVVIVQNQSELFSPLTAMTWRMAGYAMIIALIVVLLAALFSRTITEPIKTLTQGAEILGKGDLTHRVSVTSKDELHHLARTFNLMAENLHDSRQRLQQREADLKKAQNMAHLGSWEWNVMDSHLTLSEDMYRILGIDNDGGHTNIMGLMKKIVHPDDRRAVIGQIEDVLKMQAAEAENLVFRIMRDNGDIRWLEARPPDVNRLTDDGRPLSLLGTVQDITARRQAEEEVHQLRHDLSSIIDSMPSVLISVDARGLVTLWNSEAMKLTGLSADDAVGRPLEETFPALEPEMEWVRDAMASREVRVASKKALSWNDEVRHKDITVYPVMDQGSGGVVIRVDDVTEKVRLEDMVLQHAKMQSVGALAAGIAHDFNNILASIIGYTELAKLDSPHVSTSTGYLDQLLQASQRAKELVQQILQFSRQGRAEKQRVNLGVIVKEALKLLRASIPSTIEIHRNIDASIGAIEADPTQIHQIIMNLCTNASHAMVKTGGHLTIELTSRTIRTEDLSVYPDLSPGPYLLLIVTDTGHGMDDETLSRIFDPYFTTKAIGEGTGMGLATVHGIVKKHDGDIKAFSSPGSGTSFHVLFPMVSGVTDATNEHPEEVQKGHERILLVDDEDLLVEVGEKMLTQLGYKVESSTSSFHALSAFRSRPYHYDLVITDMTMPHMTGSTLAAEIRKHRSDIPIIICTGYNSDLLSKHPEELGVSLILSKPLTFSELSRAVRQTLETGTLPEHS